MVKKESHKFSAGEIFILAPDVLHIVYTEKRKLNVEDVTDIRDKRLELLGDVSYYPIVDMGLGILKFTEEAKAWVAVNKEGIAARNLDIFLVKNLVMKFKVKLYLTLFKPANATRVVSSLQEALKVVEEHKLSARQKTA